MLTIADIKALLDAQPGPIMNGPTLYAGQIEKSDGMLVDYTIHGGWNIQVANACDAQWGAFNSELINFITSQNLDEAALVAVLENVQLDDSHWEWLKKSLAYRSDEYVWFFLMAEEQPQCACLIYHPKDSVIDGTNIFYIEYIAAAPWNRSNPMVDRRFRGIGRLMIDFVRDYAVQVLGLRPGYSLHALPKAVPFYLSLGMVAYPVRDKGDLPYFELPMTSCPKAAGVANGL